MPRTCVIDGLALMDFEGVGCAWFCSSYLLELSWRKKVGTVMTLLQLTFYTAVCFPFILTIVIILSQPSLCPILLPNVYLITRDEDGAVFGVVASALLCHV